MIGGTSRRRAIAGALLGICYAAFLLMTGYSELRSGFRRRMDPEIHAMLLTSSIVVGITAGVVLSRVSRRTARSVVTALVCGVLGAVLGSAAAPRVNGSPSQDLDFLCAGVLLVWMTSLLIRLPFRRRDEPPSSTES
jgi:uncharacterized membrane protein YfcA